MEIYELVGIIVLGFALYSFIITVLNVFTLPRSVVTSASKKVVDTDDSSHNLSILIPARNESRNIAACLDALREVQEEVLEIIVLDDFSDDDTFNMAASYLSSIRNLKVKRSNEPSGGKNSACQQLASSAAGQVYLFIDADVILKKGAAAYYYQRAIRENVDLLSCFPQQIYGGLGERLTIPMLIYWLLLTIPPYFLNLIFPTRMTAVACGQFMMVKSSAYRKIGGHRSLSLVEDFDMARKILVSGGKVKTYHYSELVQCRMAQDFSSSIQTLSRSLFFFLNNSLLFLQFTILFFILYLLPWTMIENSIYFQIAILLHFGAWLLVGLFTNRGRNLILDLLLFPLSLLTLFITLVYALLAYLLGWHRWKERKIL